MKTFKAIPLESALKLVSGPLSIWVFLELARGVVVSAPQAAGWFVLGVMFGPLLWRCVAGCVGEGHSLLRTWWHARRHSRQRHG